MIGVIIYGLVMVMVGVCVLFLLWVVFGAVRDGEWKTAGGMFLFALVMAEAIPDTEPPLP